MKEKFKKTCYEFIDSAIYYTNNYIDYRKKVPNIEIEIVDSLCFNSTAIFCSENNYKINITSEVFTQVYRIFNTLLSSENDMFYKTISLDEQYNYAKANKFFDYLFEISIKMIVFHEVGHILDGHSQYQYTTLKETQLHMVPYMNALTPIESQILEMDADSFAATVLVSMFTFDDNINRLNRKELFIQGKEHVLFLIGVALTVVFGGGMGLGRERTVTKTFFNGKYMPIRTRLHYILKCMTNTYIHLNPTFSYKMSFQMLTTIANLTEKHMNLYKRDVEMFPEYQWDISNGINEIDDEHIRYINTLEDYWSNKMIIQLKEFAYISLCGEI